MIAVILPLFEAPRALNQKLAVLPYVKYGPLEC